MEHKEVWALALGRVASTWHCPFPAWVSRTSVPYLWITCHGAFPGCLKAPSITPAQVEAAGSCSAQESAFSEAAWLEAPLAQPGAGVSAAWLAHSNG